ncbi:MAG: hypothetical protein ABIS35_11985 [Terracoccus sp.]
MTTEATAPERFRPETTGSGADDGDHAGDHDGARRRRRPSRTGAALPPRLRRRRRRLLLASAPVVVLVAVLALRLLTLNLVADRTLEAWTSGDRPTMSAWAQRQGWVDVVERFRAPFALGDAAVLGGRFAQARPSFEQAFALVPRGGLDDCKVRVNLALTYEALGDAARAAERTDEWQQFYAKGKALTEGRPALCDSPDGEGSGQRLQDAQQRMDSKSADPPPADAPPSDPSPQPQPAPQPTPDPQRTPSQQEQDLLQEMQRRNTVERNEQLGTGDRRDPQDGGPAVPKPW